MRWAIGLYDCSYVMMLYGSYIAERAASLLILQTANTRPAKLAFKSKFCDTHFTRVGTLIVANIYLQLIQNRYMFRSFTVLQCSHQHCVQPVASHVEVVGYL